MTTHALARELLRGDDVRVVVRGCDMGVNDITKLTEGYLHEDANVGLPTCGRHDMEFSPLYTDYWTDPPTTRLLPRVIELEGDND